MTLSPSSPSWLKGKTDLQGYVRLNLLKQVLAVPTCSRQEGQMVAFLNDHVREGGERRRGRCWSDEFNNVYVIKGSADHYPCVAAHIDTVHPMKAVRIEQQNGMLVGFDERGQRTGIGADDKAGVFLCLELLERFDNIAVVLFAQEEIGFVGAQHAQPEFFERVGCVLEFDAPANGLVSYTSGGVRLFRNDGDFIRAAMPVLEQFGFTHFQHHPFTDVKAVRQRFALSCFNFSAGYYNWHAHDEYLKLADVENALAMATELIPALGERRYDDNTTAVEDAEPPMEVTGLRMPTDEEHELAADISLPDPRGCRNLCKQYEDQATPAIRCDLNGTAAQVNSRRTKPPLKA